MKTHTATIRVLGTLEIGKFTSKNSGVKIEVFDKGDEDGKKGPKLGTIQIGRGTFAWRAAGTKTETKKGKKQPQIILSWSDFADFMNKNS